MFVRPAVLVAGAAVLTVTACSGSPSGPPQPPAAPSHAPAPSAAAPPAASPGAPAAGPAADPVAGAVDRNGAGAVATGRYGGRVLNVEPDTAHGVPTWEVEVEVAGSRQGRIEVDVSQRDGRILELERD